MDIAAAKSTLRKEMSARRKSVQCHVCPDQATRRLLRYLRALAVIDVVAGYLPIGSEIDPRPAMTRLLAEGYRVCVPVVASKDAPLVFRNWTPGTTLVEGAFGAPIPADDVPATPEALIVPLLAFDRRGYRLGYGGGYYDRTLAQLSAGRRIYGIGFAYEDQGVDTVPREETDRRLDAVVTERATYML